MPILNKYLEKLLNSSSVLDSWYRILQIACEFHLQLNSMFSFSPVRHYGLNEFSPE